MNHQAHQDWLKLMKKGVSAFQAHSLKTAFNYFSNATKSNPERFEGWVNLAETTNQLKRHSEAIEYCKKALSINEKLPQAYQILGDALLESGNAREALPYFKRALSLSVNAGSLYRIARCLSQLGDHQEAEKRVTEAIAMDSNLAPAHTLLAAIRLMLKKPDDALAALNGFPDKSANQDEKMEAKSITQMAEEYIRFQPAIDAFLKNSQRESLTRVVHNTHTKPLDSDLHTLDRLKQYSESLQSLEGSLKPLEKLPEVWPQYEAFFMIPLGNSPQEFHSIWHQVIENQDSRSDYLETANMVQAVEHARTLISDMTQPAKAEIALREIHALATQNITGFYPGHFKFIKNKTAASSIIERPQPHQVINTIRTFFHEIYPAADDGLTKALLVLMAIGDIHPFLDGNGRVAITLVNRELEKAALHPILLDRALGITGKLGIAMNAFRQAPDAAPDSLLTVVQQGQDLAIAFIANIDYSGRG